MEPIVRKPTECIGYTPYEWPKEDGPSYLYTPKCYQSVSISQLFLMEDMSVFLQIQKHTQSLKRFICLHSEVSCLCMIDNRFGVGRA